MAKFKVLKAVNQRSFKKVKEGKKTVEKQNLTPFKVGSTIEMDSDKGSQLIKQGFLEAIK